MAAGCGAYFLSFVAMRLSLHSTVDDNVAMTAWRRRRMLIAASLILIDFCGTFLSWLTPWAGYAAAVTTVCVLLVLPSPPEAAERFEREAAESA